MKAPLSAHNAQIREKVRDIFQYETNHRGTEITEIGNTEIAN